jgi:hypothetical protein
VSGVSGDRGAVRDKVYKEKQDKEQDVPSYTELSWVLFDFIKSGVFTVC